jgi:SAM-dependent methyltransferase
METSEIKTVVRERYAGFAEQGTSCCGGAGACGPTSIEIGYSAEELQSAPEGADLGLGCGNPVALASLREGETVLDLGSGPGLDCFLAARRVGPSGRVIGVDMTPQMLDRARQNLRRTGLANVEFRLGEIEHLPVADSSVDVVISNCVINLAPDKPRVFAEAFRALRPGGRLMVSDIVLTKELPPAVKDSVLAYVGCVAGASLKDDYLAAIRGAGFEDVSVAEETSYPADATGQFEEVAGTVRSIRVKGVKPAAWAA